MEQYFYLDSNNQQQGPVDENDLLRYGVTRETLVWKAGMENWETVESIPELAFLFTGKEETPPPVYTQPAPDVVTTQDDQYYYLDSYNQQQGPVSKSTLSRYTITPETLVWKDGMSNWVPARTLPELSSLFTDNTQQRPSTTYTPPPANPRMAPGSSDSYLRYREKPDNYLVWAILVTVLCCLAGGIVAIIKASKVNSLWEMGKHDEAIKASEDAKKWCIISAAIGIVTTSFYLMSLFSGIY